jgi:signal transduction histidine kinase/CheY-like chemotaxis protein
MPYDESVGQIIEAFKGYQNIDIRFIQRIADPKVMFLIVDRRISLAIEIRDDLTETFIQSLGVYTYHDNDADVLSYISAFEYLWIQTEAYEARVNNDKIKEEFINICAHELRTPIHPIVFLSDLLYGKLSDANQRQILEVIIRNAKRLQKLADDLLEITRIDTNTLKLRKELFNFSDFIVDLVEDYRNNILKEDKEDSFDAKVMLSVPPNELFLVEADKDRLTQVIYNILNNAIKFNKEGPIYVYIQDYASDGSNDFLKISIKDNGPGIAAEILPMLFTKFTTGSDTGTGLGLFICKGIVEAHGGRIWAENNRDGRGSTFYFTIPITMRQQLLDQISPSLCVNVNILIVCKDREFASSLKETLAKKGHTVYVFDETLVAIKDFIAGYYSLAIIDIEMPVMDGFDFGQEVRKRDNKVQLCFLTSGGTNYEPLREIYNISDKDKFIKKTNDLEKLVKQLQI